MKLLRLKRILKYAFKYIVTLHKPYLWECEHYYYITNFKEITL